MIIGLIGHKGAGKTVVADHLVAKYGFVKHNFKDALIREMKRTLPDVLQELAAMHQTSVDNLFTTKPPLMRKLMQNYGTELRRGDNKDYWTEWWVAKLPPSTQNIVVDDVRFNNEALRVVSVSGYLVRIIKDSPQHQQDAHASEVEQDSIIADHTITAKDGDTLGLCNQIDELCNSIGINKIS